jgi:GNAT superfamily N-acetyltransferase
MSVTIRAATANDAGPVALLGREFVAYLRSLGDPHPCSLSAAEYRRDGFGENPAFSGLIAELEGDVVGILLYCPSYDLDLGGRIIYIIDLFVRETARRQGAARTLMEAVARICRQAGGKQLLWAVYTPNTLAKDFYEKLGATYIRDLQFMHLPV